MDILKRTQWLKNEHAALNVLANGLVKLNFSLDEIKSIINPWAKGELDKPIVLSKQQV